MLHAMVEQAPELGSIMVLTGDPGVGKSALADAAVEHALARGLDVLRASGVEAEQDVPWATLHQLLHVLRDRVTGLPTPQREALEVAFGARADSRPGVFMTGVAALTLVSDHAHTSGLLIVVEDEHWIDAATRSVLAFLARRLRAERIMLLLTARPSDDVENFVDAPGATRLTVPPLSEVHSRELLAVRRDPLPPRMTDRIVAESLGNPLALMELSATVRRLSPSSIGRIPLTKRLQNAFAHRLSALTAEQQAVVLIAAVSASFEASAILDAAGRLLGRILSVRTVDSLVALDLLSRTRDELHFRHPLVRSTVLQTATSVERIRAHRAVAVLLPAGTDRRLWHLAVVAEIPDETLAGALESSADRVLEGGDPTTAMTAYRRAAELSPEDEDRARRSYRAAAVALGLHLVVESRELLDEAGRLSSDQALRARITWLRQLIPGGAVDRGDIDTTIDIADEYHRTGQGDQAVSLFVAVGARHWGSSPSGPIWRTMIDRAIEYGAVADDPRLLWLRAFGSPGPDSRSVRTIIGSMRPSDDDDIERLRLLAAAHALSGDVERSSAFMEPAIERLRLRGEPLELSSTLLTATVTESFLGRFRQMRGMADEARRLAEEASQPFLSLTADLHLQMAHAFLGEDVDLGGLPERFPEAAEMFDRNPFSAVKLIVQGIEAAGAGDHRAAFEFLSIVVEPSSPQFHWAWALNVAFPHFIDAAVRSGEFSSARRRMEELEAVDGLADSPQHRSQILLARALLADDDDVEPAFATALSPECNVLPYWRARAALVLGERLRRRRRIVESRPFLRLARSEFDRMQVRSWARVARDELEAAGETSPRRNPDAGSALTPQEERVALLAREGRTNREIAEMLFLSPRTVATHLLAVYRKLGISSRTDLGILRD